jgi:hypothetical protein
VKEKDMSQAFHKFWLKITAVVVASFAPIFFLGAIEPLAEPARFVTDLLSWPLDGKQSFAEPTTRFVSAVTGGLLLGWGVMIWFLSGPVYDAAPEGVRRVVVVGLLSWFVLDSAGSILSGNASNAVFNAFVLLIAVEPLWRPATR